MPTRLLEPVLPTTASHAQTPPTRLADGLGPFGARDGRLPGFVRPLRRPGWPAELGSPSPDGWFHRASTCLGYLKPLPGCQTAVSPGTGHPPRRDPIKKKPGRRAIPLDSMPPRTPNRWHGTRGQHRQPGETNTAGPGSHVPAGCYGWALWLRGWRARSAGRSDSRGAAIRCTSCLTSVRSALPRESRAPGCSRGANCDLLRTGWSQSGTPPGNSTLGAGGATTRGDGFVSADFFFMAWTLVGRRARRHPFLAQDCPPRPAGSGFNLVDESSRNPTEPWARAADDGRDPSSNVGSLAFP